MDANLQRALRAAVRVGGGSGVVLARTSNNAAVIATAQHVVGKQASVRVEWSGGSTVAAVYQRNEELDVALVEAPPELEDAGLALGARPAIGESGWLLGFGNEWDGTDALISRAMASGVRTSGAWLDGTASWGHSGGPFVVVRDGELVVVGFVRGNVSRVHQRLREMKAVNDDVAERLRLGSSLGPGPQDIMQIIKARNDQYAAAITDRMTQTLEMIEQHYRAGFLDCGLGEHIASIR